MNAVSLIAACFLFAGVAPAGQDAERRPAKDLSYQAWLAHEDLREQIDRDIAKHDQILWAGRYGLVDLTGFVISLSPKNVFYAHDYGCLGIYGFGHGVIEERDGALVLKLSLLAERVSLRRVRSVYYPVRWGNCRYLVAADSTVKFANFINAGGEPGWVREDWVLPATDNRGWDVGQPEAPPQLARLLLAQPLRLTMVAAGPPEPRLMTWRTRVRLPAGKSAGIFEGMRLYPTEGNPSDLLTIESVGDDWAEGTLVQTGSAKGYIDPATSEVTSVNPAVVAPYAPPPPE